MKAWKDELKASQFPDHLTIQVARTSAMEQAALIGKILEEMGWIRTGGETSKGDVSEDGKTRYVDSWFTEERDFELVDGLGEKGRKALITAAYSGMVVFAAGLVSLIVFASHLSILWGWALVAITFLGAMLGLLGATIADTGTYESTLAMIRLEGTFSDAKMHGSVEIERGDFVVRIGLGRVQSYNQVSKSSSGRHSWGLVEGKRFQTELSQLSEKLQSSTTATSLQLPSSSVQAED